MSSISGLGVLLGLDFDTSAGEAKLAVQQAAIDRQQAEWKLARLQMISEMRDLNQGIQLMIQTIRTVVRATGQTLDPIQAGLLSIISAVSSMMVATATAMALGSLGILTGAALALGAFAASFSVTQSALLVASNLTMKDVLARQEDALARLGEDVRFAGGLIG